MSELGQEQRHNAVDEIIKLAIFAVGGQGGGVLNSWIVDVAERNGYDVQATSVAGVAQRTGATVYYVEMLQHSHLRPVFSLAPAEGDIDILLAAELMEAGRAITRGYVTPKNTTVVVSTHRQLATVEKIVPGDGTADSDKVLAAVHAHSSDVIAFDMQRIAEAEGTVISAALFGALAGSGALPFTVESYRETVRASGRGVEKSLAAFDKSQAIASGEEDPDKDVLQVVKKQANAVGPAKLFDAYAQLLARIDKLPVQLHEIARAGTKKVIDFQDVAYGDEYITLIEKLVVSDYAAGGEGKQFLFSVNAAKNLANAMSYDDIIRVADAKTREGRFGRIASEVSATNDQLIQVTEYTHPGAAEIVSTLPHKWALRFEARPTLMRWIDRLVNRGRHIRTDRLLGFLSFFLLAGLRPWRRRLLRHKREWVHINAWLQLAEQRLAKDYDFAAETLNIRRLVKGYSDTHARGLSKFDRVVAGSQMVGNLDNAVYWTKRLIESAVADSEGVQLDSELQRIRTVVEQKKSSIA